MSDTTNARRDENIWPAIFSDDPRALRWWLVGLGFEEGIVVPGERPDSIRHSELLWPEGGRVMVASRDATGEYAGVAAVAVYVVTADPDAVHARALALGAQLTRPLEDQQGYASRGFSCIDPDGNRWSFGTYAG